MSSTEAPARLARWGFGLLAAAVGAGALVYFVLMREHVRVDRGSYHYWTTYPLGESTALATAWGAVVLAGAGILCLVLAAFLGPAPRWWTRSDGSPRAASGLLILAAVVVVPTYAVWAVPWLEEDSTAWALVVGALCVIAAFRASSWVVALPLAVLAVALVGLGSGQAVLLLGHGALAIALAGVLAVAVGAERSWTRGSAAAVFLAGLLLWLYVGWLMLFLYGCGPPGCFY